jgi:hypothetical protein
MEHAVAGAFAGVVGTVLGSPLDTIKTRLQAQAAGSSSSMLPVARHIYRHEGLRGFYRGLAPPLAALTVLNTLSFSSYSMAKRVLGVEKVPPHVELPWALPGPCRSSPRRPLANGKIERIGG